MNEAVMDIDELEKHFDEQPEGAIPAPTEMAPKGIDPFAPQTVRNLDDEGLIVEFFRCLTSGEDLVRIEYPGDTKTIPVLIATDEFKQRFPRQWQMYKSGADEFVGLTHIADAPFLTEVERSRLAAFKIKTVEHLAAVTDTHVDKMHIRDLRDRAAAWMRENTASPQDAKMQSEIEALKKQNADLAAQIANLAPKRGRARKAQPLD